VVALTDSRKRISALRVGNSGMVSHFSDNTIGGKLMSMGILPGSSVKILRKAPFGGGCYVKVDNMLIGLRKEEANSIILT